MPVAQAADITKKLHHVASDVKAGDLASSKTYVSVFEYGENIGISYALFYPHNGDIFLSQGSGSDYGDVICWLTPWLCNVVDWVAGDEGVHEGDWENVKVVINKNSGQIVDVYISAHHSESGWHPLSNFETQSGRAVVYSAIKSHANYRTSGLQLRIEETFGVANDQTDRGTLWALKDHVSLIGGDYATNNQYPWVSYDGRWGGTNEEGFSNTNSPAGKKFTKSWFRNWVEDHQSVDISNGDLRDLVKHEYANALDLATTHAPNIYLHSDEPNMPSSVPWYLDRVELTVDDTTTLDEGEVSQWSVVNKSQPLVRDLSQFSKGNSTLEATNEKYNNQNVWKIATTGVEGYLQNVNAGATFTLDDKVYEFSVHLKAESGTAQLVTLRLRDKERENIVEQDFVVTDQWQKYAINTQFGGEHTGLSMFIYPAGKVAGNQGHVYAADAQLNRIVSYYKTIAGRRWIKHNSMVGQGVCADGSALLPAGIVSDSCSDTGRFYSWIEA
ncbi:MAG: Vps62-related protein [Algicola sp.]|nr:Vps62-related protein [Algicola sp.]